MNPELLFGTGASSAKNESELYGLIKECIIKGILAFDTAPSYKTESILGKLLNGFINAGLVSRERLFVQTKIDGWQMQDGRIEEFTKNVLKEMHLDYLDSLLIHWPFPEYLEDSWDKMINLKRQGYVKRIGMCNLRARNIKELGEKGIVPEIIQIERNPLNTMNEEISVLEDTDIWVQAYSPLCKMDDRIKESEILKSIADKYKKNVGQVVLRWSIDTGVSPIFTTTKTARIGEYVEIFDFSLNTEEIENISSLNENYKLYLESFQCPGL